MIDGEKIFSFIDKSDSILLVCHRNPDSDTIGAAGAMAFYISSFPGKKVAIFCSTPFPESLSFLNVHQFLLPPNGLHIPNYDLVIALDCADLGQAGLGDYVSQIYGQIPFLSIDHHATNTKYADLNIIDSLASAASEIVYRLFKKQNIILTKEISTCLLAGIVSDTSYFSNGATTKQSISTAAELLRQGVSLKQIINGTLKKHSTDSLKVWGKTLSNLHFNPKYKAVVAVIEENELTEPEQLDGLSNFLTQIYDANLIIVMYEGKHIIRCSMRTTNPHVDVSKIAKMFGGGGHAKAAGFSIKGKLEKVGNGWQII